MVGSDGRVMAHLLADVPVLGCHELVCLAKHRIEGFLLTSNDITEPSGAVSCY